MQTELQPAKAAAPTAGVTEVDVLIVGAGFSGCYLLHKLRVAGFKAKVIEAGNGYGGVWHWNCYPGARVDSPVPIYEYDIPEVWRSWSWPEMFPSGPQIREYFEHVDRLLDLSKDTIWNTKVAAAEWVEKDQQWVVVSHDGRKFRSQHLIMATGFAAKRSFPSWPGLASFQGEIHHSSFWPYEGVDLKGKRVGVVGTGSTGLQIAQTIVDSVEHLTVFQRTPNLALPLLQHKLVNEEEEKRKQELPEQFKARLTTFSGYLYDSVDRATFADSPKQREAFYNELWAKGGFHFWLASYKDLLSNIDANKEAYSFWVKKVRQRIQDPAVADILAPLTPPHPFGTKRPALEWRWYDMFNEKHVQLVDVQATPVDFVTEKGIVAKDGKLHELDAIALATGFDAITGGLNNIDIKSRHGRLLREKWAGGARTALGMMVSDYPNMFMLYGPQGPTAFSNGPSCIEIQGDWLVEVLKELRRKNVRTIDAKPAAEERWEGLIEDITSKTLFPLADSWYMGANIPGKTRQMLNYTGGIPAYAKELERARTEGYDEFNLA